MLARLLIMVPIIARGIFSEEAVQDWKASEDKTSISAADFDFTPTWEAEDDSIRYADDSIFFRRRRQRSIGSETSTDPTEAPLSTATTAILISTPLITHWVFLLVLYAWLNIASFWRLSLKKKMIHMLSNTLVILPVKKQKQKQVHKKRELAWSLVLVGINLLTTALVTSAVISVSLDEEYNAIEEDSAGNWLRFFIDSKTTPSYEFSSDGWLTKTKSTKYTVPKFFLCFGLPSLLCHLVGSLLLLFHHKLTSGQIADEVSCRELQHQS